MEDVERRDAPQLPVRDRAEGIVQDHIEPPAGGADRGAHRPVQNPVLPVPRHAVRVAVDAESPVQDRHLPAHDVAALLREENDVVAAVGERGHRLRGVGLEAAGERGGDRVVQVCQNGDPESGLSVWGVVASRHVRIMADAERHPEG